MNIIASKIYYYLPEKSIITKLFQVLSKNNPTWLIFFFAFEGASVAIAFSTAYYYLFKERAVDTLPYIFIFSGISIMAMARITAYLERRMRQEHLNAFYAVLKLIFQLLIWYLSFGDHDFLSIILLVMSVKIIIFLEDCTYWSVTENTFTSIENRKYFERAKSLKLFSKLAGFIFVVVFSKIFSHSSIAFIGLIFSLFSGWSVWQIFTSKNSEEHLKGYHQDITRPSRKYTPESFWIFGITNPYIFKIGILTLSISCVWAIIEFFFMIDLRMTVYSPKKGIMVLSLLLIIGYAVVSIVQPYFSTRKLQDIGIKKLLLIPPIILFVFIVITYLLLRLHPTEIPLLLALIAIAFIFTRNIIFSTVQSSLLRPIKRKHRGFSYGIIRGFFGATGLLVSGILLWALDADSTQKESSSIIVWLLIGLLFCWWFMARFVSRDYRVILRRAFLLRDMESYEIATHDKEVNRLLNSKLMSKMPEDIIYALEANTIINPKKNETIVLHMLRHPDAAIRYFSIEFGENNMTDRIQDAITSLAKEELDPLVRKKAIVVTCKYQPDFIKEIIDLIDHKDTEVRKGALYGLLSSKDDDMRDIALNYIKNTIDSDDVFQAMLALEVLAKTSPKDSEPYILDALLSDNKIRIKAGIKITSIVKSPMHIPILISLLKDNKFNDTILRSLINYGEDCLSVIENELFVNKRREDIYLITLCKVMGKIKSPKSFEILWQLVEYPWPLMRMAAYNALKRLKYTPEAKSDFDLMFKLLERFFSNYYWVCNAIFVLNHEKPIRQLMIKALEDELLLIEQKIRIIQGFLVAGFEAQLYSKEQLVELDRNTSLDSMMRNAETEKNLWRSLPQSIYQKLMIVLGYYNLEVKMQKLGDYYSANLVDTLSITLGIIRPFSYNRPLFNTWTKITALISVRDSMSPSLIKFIGQILNKDELRLIEPAAIGLKRILDYQDLPIEKTLDELVSEEKKELIMGILSEGTKPLLELEKVILLKSTNLFREVPEHVLVDIASITHEIRVQRDTSIFRKGEESREMYIIYEGEVRLHDGVSTYSVLINRDFFGDLSILDSSPRTLSATTTKDSVLLKIEQDDFLALMGYRRSLMVGIMKVLGQRIRKNEKSSSFTKEKI